MISPSRFHRALLSLTLAGCAASLAGAVEITLPPETARLIESPLPGYVLASASCATCHSYDYIRTQPPTLSRTAWKAGVTKMQKIYGAPVPDNAIEPIVDYIVKTYGPERAGAAETKPQTNAAAPKK